MITKNYKNTARNSRIGRAYVSLKAQLTQDNCPNCWGTQEYNDQKIEAKELKAPKKSYRPITLIHQLASAFTTNNDSKSNCTIC